MYRPLPNEKPKFSNRPKFMLEERFYDVDRGRGRPVNHNSARQFAVAPPGGAIIVREELGRLDKTRDHQFSEVAEKQAG
jgi:hypothetical protein